MRVNIQIKVLRSEEMKMEWRCRDRVNEWTCEAGTCENDRGRGVYRLVCRGLAASGEEEQNLEAVAGSLFLSAL